MGEVGIIGLNLAKNAFQAHGAAIDGSVVFRRKLSRAQLMHIEIDLAGGYRVRISGSYDPDAVARLTRAVGLN